MSFGLAVLLEQARLLIPVLARRVGLRRARAAELLGLLRTCARRAIVMKFHEFS